MDRPESNSIKIADIDASSGAGNLRGVGNGKAFRDLLSDEAVVEYYGDEAIRIHKQQNYDDYQESSERFEREYGRKPDGYAEEMQQRERCSEGTWRFLGAE
ncbi:MAG: hypothetical protein PUD55_03030 [Firmicutes bacterium]|nr:hypothetical protein [Bacillota bacterium]